MGAPYTYEKVLEDSERYPKVSGALYLSWWETYLREEGFPNEYRPITELGSLVSTGEVAGIVMLTPVLGDRGHVVAVDELGIINPATNWPTRIPNLNDLVSEYARLGCKYRVESIFLSVAVGAQRALKK